MWNDEVELIRYIDNKLDDLNQFVESVEEAIVISCNKLAITSSEFYFATQSKMQIALKLEIHEFEYSDQEFLRYNNNLYKIIRTYPTNNNLLELTCESVITND